MKLHNTEAKSWIKFLMFIVIFFCMLIVGTIVVLPLIPYLDISLTVQAVSSIVMFGGAAFIYGLLFEKKGFLVDKFCRKAKGKWFIIALLVWLVGLPFLNEISVDSDYNSLLQELITDTSFLGLLALIVVMAIIPAIVEEWLFRGVLQNILIRWTKHVWIGILLTSAIFSLIHLDMPNFFARLVLGLILGLLYQYSGNMWVNIFYHFVNNCIAAIGMWYYVKTGEETLDNYKFPIYLVLFSIILLLGFIIYNELKNPKSIKNNYIETDNDSEAFVTPISDIAE